jgi:hypothetical protein
MNQLSVVRYAVIGNIALFGLFVLTMEFNEYLPGVLAGIIGVAFTLSLLSSPVTTVCSILDAIQSRFDRFSTLFLALVIAYLALVCFAVYKLWPYWMKM